MTRCRRAAAAVGLVVVLVAGCGDDGVSITEQARNDLDGRLDAIGLAISAGQSGAAGEAVDELVAQAERYAEDGQISEERLAAILASAEELREQLGESVTPATTTTLFQPPPTAEAPVDQDEGDGDEGDGGRGNGNGNGNGNGRGNGNGDGDDD